MDESGHSTIMGYQHLSKSYRLVGQRIRDDPFGCVLYML